LAEILLRKQAIKRWYIFSPHLINASALPCETENTEIVSFHFNLFSATLPRPFVQFPALLCSVISDLLTRRLCWCRQLAVRHWVTAHFRRLQQEPGIRCLIMSGTCLPCLPSTANSRLYCLGCRTLSNDSFSTVALFHDTDIVRWSCSSNV